jgi:hypothetical protein
VLQLAASVQFVVPAPPVQVTVVVIGVPLGAISGVAPPVGGSEGGSEDCVVFPPGVFPPEDGPLGRRVGLAERGLADSIRRSSSVSVET